MKNRKTMDTTEVPMRTEKEVAQPRNQEPNPKASPRTPTPMESYMSEVAQEAVNERLNSIPFKNSSINVFDKKRYDISREFDGQEVPGSLTVRPTLSGGTVETERFDIPGAGTSTSRVRKNAEGQTVRRVVKDKNINK